MTLNFITVILNNKILQTVKWHEMVYVSYFMKGISDQIAFTTVRSSDEHEHNFYITAPFYGIHFPV